LKIIEALDISMYFTDANELLSETANALYVSVETYSRPQELISPVPRRKNDLRMQN
jgi:hypothetical protein